MAEQPIGVMTVNSSSTETQLQITNDDEIYDDVKMDECVMEKKKKSVNILKVALMLLRRQQSRKSSNNPAVDVASKGMWNRLVGVMRLLHLQTDQLPPLQVVPSLPTTEPTPPVLHPSPSLDNFEDVNSSTSSVIGMSRYASAVNLHDVDQNDEDNEEGNNDKVNVNIDGEDEMIDAKAEMFIAQFYAQMKLQRSESDIRYDEMIQRSIG